jgi:uncharacterized membrane protein YjgN (DUF898 family)
MTDAGIPNARMAMTGIDLKVQDADIRPPPDVTTTGEGLMGMALKGTLLTIVTLGIYRFWYKTNLRRWYWHNTQVSGHAFEYRGTGKELFIGFLIAIAVLSPLYLIGYLTSIIPNTAVRVIVSVTLGAAYLLIAQYGVFRGRRYRMTRTLWRGLRFDMVGSAWGYAFKSFGWLLLTVVTLGLALPVARCRLEGLKICATRFGSAEGAFEVPIMPLMKRWIVIYIAVIATFIGVGALMNMLLGSDMIYFFFALIFMPVLAFLILWPWYKTAELRTFMNGSRIGPVSFISRLPTSRIYIIYFQFIAALLGMVAIIGSLTYGMVNARASGPLAVMFVFFLYLGLFTLFAVLKEVIVNQGLWRWMAATLYPQNLSAVDDVIGSAVNIDSATGEGFADAIDFGGV